MFTSTERRKVSENILPDWTTLCVENVGVEENFQLGWRKWCCPLNGFLVIFVGIQELFTSYKYASQLKEVLEDSSFLQLVEHFNPEQLWRSSPTPKDALTPFWLQLHLYCHCPSYFQGLQVQGFADKDPEAGERRSSFKAAPTLCTQRCRGWSTWGGGGRAETELPETVSDEIGWKYSNELMCHHLLYFPPALSGMLRSILRPEEAATNAKTSKPANKSREAGGRGWRWTCSRSSTLPRLSCRAHPLHKYPTPPTFHL